MSNEREQQIHHLIMSYARDMERVSRAPLPTNARTWQRRIHDLRMALGWSIPHTAPMIGLTRGSLAAAEKLTHPYFPSLKTIRAVRKLEQAYHDDLTRYLNEPWRYCRIRVVRRNGRKYEKPCRAPHIMRLPDRTSYADRGTQDIGAMVLVAYQGGDGVEAEAQPQPFMHERSRVYAYHRAIERYYHHTYRVFVNRRRLESRCERLAAVVSRTGLDTDTPSGDPVAPVTRRRDVAYHQAAWSGRPAA